MSRLKAILYILLFWAIIGTHITLFIFLSFWSALGICVFLWISVALYMRGIIAVIGLWLFLLAFISGIVYFPNVTMWIFLSFFVTMASIAIYSVFAVEGTHTDQVEGKGK